MGLPGNSLGVKLAMLVVSLAAGLAVSRWVEDRRKAEETSESHDFVVEVEPTPEEEPPREEPPREKLKKSPLEEIDFALRGEEYERALKIGRAKREEVEAELLPGFRYREALALEGCGEYLGAEAIYRQVADMLHDPQAKLRVRLRRACCLAHLERVEEAKTLLSQLHREASRMEHPDAVFFQELFVLTAMIETSEWAHPASPNCERITQLSVPSPVFPVRRWVAWADEVEERPFFENDDFHLPAFPAPNPVQAIRDALEVAPNHPLSAYLVLALACDLNHQDRRPTAIHELTRLLEKYPHDPVAVHAVYNRGLLQLQESEFDTAKESFLEVVDRTIEPKWKALGWWWLGRTRIDSGRFDEAIAPFEEAQHHGKNTPVERLAAMGLSMVHLQRGEPRKAHQRLDSLRHALREPACRSFAAFLDARARLSIALNQGRTALRAENDDLLETILQFPEETPLGPLIVWLVGESATEIGLGSVAKPRYEAIAKKLRGPLAVQMLFRVAEEDFRSGRTNQAKVSFAAATVDRGEWGIRARLELGKIALREEQPHQALKQASEVYSLSEESRETALVLMGKAYMLLGDPARAVVCFGGEVPE